MALAPRRGVGLMVGGWAGAGLGVWVAVGKGAGGPTGVHTGDGVIDGWAGARTSSMNPVQ